MVKIDNVVIKIVPHREQRYETVGDWMYLGDTLYIFISNMGNDDYHQLVAIHEYVEALLCRKDGIKETAVTAFDIEYEKNRPEGNFDEPGNCPAAPYYEQHQTATQIEKLMALKLGVNWEAYDAAVNSL